MNKKSKRQTDPALASARRDQVLCAAADCFKRKGYHGAGMAEIAKTAGMSAGHIYNYFESKEAIIESIIERDMEEMVTIFQQFEDQAGGLVPILLNGLDDCIDRNTDVNQAALNLEMLSEAARNEKVAMLLREADSRAREKMRNLLLGERSPIHKACAEEIDSRVEVMFSMMSGLLLRKTLNPTLDKQTLLIAIRPVMVTLLTPFE